MNKKEYQIIKVGNFNVKYYKKIPEIRAEILFERENLSQKLIFSLMAITYEHGLSCSPPQFQGVNEKNLYFSISLPLSSTRIYKKGLDKMHDCLLDIDKFSKEFLKQLNFDHLDISMFEPEDVDVLFPEQLAALRDQQYEGSWTKMYEELKHFQQEEDAKLIKKCMEFETKNNKDLGFVGYKLNYFLELIVQEKKETEIN